MHVKERGAATSAAVVLALLLVATIVLGVWFFAASRIRTAFAAMSSNWPATIPVAPLDPKSKDFLAGPRTGWEQMEGDRSGLFSQIIRACGLQPSVRVLTNMLVSPTPPYSRWDQSRNRRSMLQGTVKEILESLNTGTNETTMFVSDDAHAALLWSGESHVLLFEDDPSGMTQQWYRTAGLGVTQQDGAANGGQPIRSETNQTSSPAGSRR
jgi:hypothetical protein